MPEYFSYYAGMGRDYTTKHVIVRGRIDTYERGAFLAALRKWHFKWSFHLAEDTQTLDERVLENGDGWVTLESNKKKYTFFIHQYVKIFIQELRSHGLP